jgi:glycosyltransferase involved in cell wall biosynthesis
MKYEPKVLIGTPIYDKKDYALKTQLEHVRKLNYTNFDHVFFDNSKSDKYYYKLKSMGLKVVRVHRGNNSRDALANSMNYMFDYAREGMYDYCLVLENDLFPDPEIVNRLLSHDKRVVCSYYFLGLDEDERKYQEAMRLARNREIGEEEYNSMVKGLLIKVPCIFVTDKKESGLLGTRILTREEGLRMFNTGIQRVHGGGFGATLLSRDVFNKFKCYYDSRFEDKHPDVYFFADLHDAGVPVYLDTSVVIPHQPSSWLSVKDK